MKREKKAWIMDRTMNDLNKAKHLIDISAQKIEEAGLKQDAERLMKIIYKIEWIQNKYDKF